jgi:hypothetical protein
MTPEQIAGLIVAVGMVGGLVWKYAPGLLSRMDRTEITGKTTERRIEDQLTAKEHEDRCDKAKVEHDERCDLKMQLLAAEISGPINHRLTLIEAHESAASAWVNSLNTKVDRLLGIEGKVDQILKGMK